MLMHAIQAKAMYDFTTIFPGKIEICGKICDIGLPYWLAIQHLVVHGTSAWYKFENYFGYEIDESSASSIRREINKILDREGSKFRISMAHHNFSIKSKKVSLTNNGTL